MLPSATRTAPTTSVETKPLNFGPRLEDTTVTVDKPAAPPVLVAPPQLPAVVPQRAGLGIGFACTAMGSASCFALAAAQSSGALSPGAVAPLFLGTMACLFVGLIAKR